VSQAWRAGWGLAVLALGAGLALGVLAGLGLRSGAPESRDRPAAGAPPTAPLMLGTGPVTGTHYLLGGAIARVVEAGAGNAAAAAPRLAVRPGAGDAASLEALAAGRLDFAIVGSDWQHHAARGQGPRAGAGAMDSLRHVLAFHAVPLAVAVRADSELRALDDLADGEGDLAVPPEGSPGRRLFRALGRELGLGLEQGELGRLRTLPWGARAGALCTGEIDVLVTLAAHPQAALHDAARGCGIRFLPVEDPVTEAVRAERPWLVAAEIPGRVYDGVIYDTPSLGTRATLVARAGLAAESVAAIAGVLLARPADLRRQHPLLARLTLAEMVAPMGGAPRHPGAAAAITRQAARQGARQPPEPGPEGEDPESEELEAEEARSAEQGGAVP